MTLVVPAGARPVQLRFHPAGNSTVELRCESGEMVVASLRIGCVGPPSDDVECAALLNGAAVRLNSMLVELC